MDVRFLRQFATPQEVAELRQWLLSFVQSGEIRQHKLEFRFHRFLGEFKELPKPIERFERDIKKKFGIEGKCIELKDIQAAQKLKATPSFIGIQLNGGYVQPHIDDNIGDMLQFRCTLLINKPEIGGKLMLAGDIAKMDSITVEKGGGEKFLPAKEYEMEEGDFYCFVSNATIHGTSKVQGTKPRMSMSLGFLVDKSFKLDMDLIGD